MPIDRDPATLIDIANACKSVMEFTQGRTQADLDSDSLFQSAVLHQLLILGEAVSRLTSEIRDSHSDINWRGYVGLRNILIHRYDEIDLDEIWNVATGDVPELSRRIVPLLPDEFFEDDTASS